MIRGDRGPGGSILVTRLSLRARVAGRDGEGQYLRRRGKETCRDAACGLVDGWRKHGSRRHDGLEAGGSLAHLPPDSLNDPAVDPRGGQAYAHEGTHDGCVGEPGRHYVVQRPIHVGQINVNEDARDVGAAR